MVNRRYKPIQRASRRRWLAAAVLLTVLIMGEFLFYAWCRVQCLQAGYAINALLQQNQKLNALQSSLRVELSRLKAPKRIVGIARQKLGLEMPRPDQVITIR
jgi:cell division protein FtsL